jgi:hypothetical protein
MAMIPKKQAKPTAKPKAPVAKPTVKAKPVKPAPKKTYRDPAHTPGFQFGKGTI